MLILLIVPSRVIAAAPQYIADCTMCHGIPPVDSAYRNVSSGGVQGNHTTHTPFPSAVPSDCEKCHPGASVFTTAHMDAVIGMAPAINNSGTYSKGAFFNQTSKPVLGSCSNINCHFESATPAWGSQLFATPINCCSCHGFPPTGTSPGFFGGAAGSHAVHSSTCSLCHPDHTSEIKPFVHATSIVKRPAIVHPLQGHYTSLLGSPLPSQAGSRIYGSCATVCHADGTYIATGITASGKSPVWGSSTTIGCTACHSYPPGYSSGSPKANSHAAHAFSCNTCHSTTTSDGITIIAGGTHGKGVYDVVPKNGVLFTYNFAVGGGTCSNVSCHSDGGTIKTWGTSPDSACGACHATPPGGDDN